MTRMAKRPPDGLFTLVTDRWTQPYWDAAAEGRLVAAQCDDCGTFRMPPTPFCPHCRSQRLRWPTLPGTGAVYSYTVVERATTQTIADHIPYVPAVIEIDGAPGVRIISNVVESDVDAIRVGARVEIVFDAITGGAIPRFRLTGETE